MTTNSAPPESLQLLVRLVAQVDALWIPLRDPREPCWPYVWELRRSFPENGINWHAGGAQSVRKSLERQLKELVAARLVKTYRRGGRTSSVALTFRGDAVARSLANLRPLDMAVELVQELHSLRDHPESSASTAGSNRHINTRPWIPETLLNYHTPGGGWGDGRSEELIDVVHRLALPQALGWVETLCDTQRHVYCRLTEPGLWIATGEAQPPAIPDDLPGRQEWAEDLYDDARAAHRGSLWSYSEYSNDIGKVPLPASFLTKGSASR